MAQSVKRSLRSFTNMGGTCVVASHPANAFHNQHKLFAEQAGFPIASLQELHQRSGGNIYLRERKVGAIFRQFATRNLSDVDITDSQVYDAIVSGRLPVVNGPLT